MPSNRKPCRVLLVEDSNDDAYLFEMLFARIPGFRLVRHAKNGSEAMAYLSGTGVYKNRRKYPFPHVMVLDLNMPRRNGFEVLEWLKGRFPELVVGIFTNSEEAADAERCRTLGAHLFQTKTYDKEPFARFLYWLGKLARVPRSAKAVMKKASQLREQTAALCETNQKVQEQQEVFRQYLDLAMAERKETGKQFAFRRKRLSADSQDSAS